MFERLHGLGDDAAAQAVENGFLEVQDVRMQTQRREMHEERLAGVRAENLALLENLGTISDQLDMPGIVAALSVSVSAQPHFHEATGRAEPLAWMPHTPAIVREDLSVQDGVRAVRGWHIEWQGANLPSATVLLYQRRTEQELIEMPRLAVVPGELEELTAADHSGRIDILLRQESAMPYRYKQLAAAAQEQDYDSLTNQQRWQFIAEARTISYFRDYGSSVSFRKVEYEYPENLHKQLWHIDWIRKDKSNERSPLILANSYADAVRSMQDERLKQSLKSTFVDPDALSEGEQVFESRNVRAINDAFSLPEAKRSWLGIKREFTGGAIGRHSWAIDAVGPAAVGLERQKIAERLEDFYVPLLTAE